MYWKQCGASFIVAVIIYLQQPTAAPCQHNSKYFRCINLDRCACHVFSLHSLCITKTYLVCQCIEIFGKKKYSPVFLFAPRTVINKFEYSFDSFPFSLLWVKKNEYPCSQITIQTFNGFVFWKVLFNNCIANGIPLKSELEFRYIYWNKTYFTV